MTTTLVKICGINTSEALDATLRARANYVGLNFYPSSPRYVAPRYAAVLGAQAEGRIGRVGVFVEADDATIAEALAAARLDVLQLHGQESPERAAQLKARFDLPVWKALSIAAAGDVARAAAYAGAADLVLFDAKTPKGTLPGGMGLAFDWNLVAGFKGAIAWGLAGGLTPGNVGEAIARTAAPLVDTSSGVETAPGVKDAGLIGDFIRAARA